MENNSGRNTEELLLTAVLIVFSIVAFSTNGLAQDTTNDLTVDVNISSRTIIDIQPKSFSWGQGTDQVEPGSLAGPSEEANSKGRIQIENLGSNNITRVWFNSSYPSQRPFGTGNPDNYDSGNFIALDSNNTNTDSNQFINRVEYGIDQPGGQDIIYLDTPSGWDFGRFRSTSQEYFWTVDDSGTDLTGNTFRVGVDPHNSSQTGSTNLADACSGGDEGSSNTQCNGYTLSVAGNGDWAYTDVEIDGLDDGSPYDRRYCAVMNETKVTSDTERPAVHFIKWDTGFPAATSGDCGTVTNNTVGAGGQTENLVPGEWIVRDIRARIPYGVVSGSIPQGTMFVLANSG